MWFISSGTISISLEHFILPIVIIVTIISFILICAKIHKLIKRKGRFVTDVSQWMALCFYVSSILFVSLYQSTHEGHNDCISEGTWRIGAIAVFLGWIIITIDLKRLPFTGVIINMLSSITLTFVKLIPIAILLTFTFALPFYMLLSVPVSNLDM